MDDLNRVVSASTTNVVGGSSHNIRYADNGIGNIEAGSDSYAGTGYANPHAVTSAGGTSYGETAHRHRHLIHWSEMRTRPFLIMHILRQWERHNMRVP